MLRDHGHILVTNWLERVEARPPMPLLEPAAARSEEYVTVCSWCKKVELPGATWVEVEEAVEHLRLFDRAVLPQLTHGICPTCLESFRGWRKQSEDTQSRGMLTA